MHSRWIFALAVLLVSPLVVAEEEIEVQNEKKEIVPVDERIRYQLDDLELAYDVDEDNDFKLLFNFDDGRSQIVFIRSKIYETHDVGMRDVWAYAYQHPTKHLPQRLERRLLLESYNTVMGSWARDGNAVVYIVKIPEDAPKDVLMTALFEAAELADELEKELVGTDEL